MTQTLGIDDYLDHMRQSVDDIRLCTSGIDLEGFQSNRIAQLASIKAIENIGEAARNLTRDHPSYTEAETSIPWRKWSAVRNRLSHGYFDIDLGVVWSVIEKNIPELETALTAIADYDRLTGQSRHRDQYTTRDGPGT